MDWLFHGLERGGYGMIVIDAPWRFRVWSRDTGLKKSADRHYCTMTMDAIAALPVSSLAADDCVLWMWATAPMLDQQIEILKGWGFKYKTCGVWVKRTITGKVHFGTGYILRSSHEMFLIGTIGKPKYRRNVRSVVDGLRREHSRKPDEAYLAAERLLPDVRRADLFAREERVGWDAWGMESQKFNDPQMALFQEVVA